MLTDEEKDTAVRWFKEHTDLEKPMKFFDEGIMIFEDITFYHTDDIPYKIYKVHGTVSTSGDIKTLENFPDIITEILILQHAPALTSLKYFPKRIYNGSKRISGVEIGNVGIKDPYEYRYLKQYHLKWDQLMGFLIYLRLALKR